MRRRRVTVRRLARSWDDGRAVATAIHRLRQRDGELVRGAVANVVANPAEVEDEIRWLFSAAA